MGLMRKWCVNVTCFKLMCMTHVERSDDGAESCSGRTYFDAFNRDYHDFDQSFP